MKTKRGLFEILVFGLFLIILCESFVSSFSGIGEGTADNPYNISTCLELNETRNNLTAYYRLVNDLNCSDTINWNDGTGWEPIGYCAEWDGGECLSEFPFEGTFDGNGYTIEGLYIYRPAEDMVGVFGYLIGRVYNLGIINSNVTGRKYVGILSGYYTTWYGDRPANISKCYTKGEVNGTDYVGGLVGYLFQGNIRESYSLGNVAGNDKVGGLIGYSSEGEISFSYSDNGFVLGADWVGGLVGWAYSTTINNTYSRSEVNAKGQFIGGLVGLLGSEFMGSIYNSYSTGNVEGLYTVGGLVGGISTDDVHNSFSTGNVSLLESGAWIGGVFGDYQSDFVIDNVYWYNSSYNSELNCYSAGECENATVISEEQGLDYFYNISNSPTSDWDFENVWSNAYNEQDYPVFQWQNALVDIIFPNVSFVSPENTTYTASSILINITNSSDAVFVWYYNGTANVSYDSSVTLTLSNGNYEFIAYANDSSGNVNSSKVNFSVAVVSTSEETSAISNGGYSSRIYNSGNEFSSLGDNFNLWSSDRVRFMVDSINHTLTLIRFNSSSAQVKIQSEPIKAWITKGVLYKFDLDNDSVYDVLVQYNGLNSTSRKAMIFIQEIAGSSEIVLENSTIPDIDKISSIDEENSSTFVRVVIFFLILILIIFVLFALIKFYPKYKLYKKRTYSAKP